MVPAAGQAVLDMSPDYEIIVNFWGQYMSGYTNFESGLYAATFMSNGIDRWYCVDAARGVLPGGMQNYVNHYTNYHDVYVPI